MPIKDAAAMLGISEDSVRRWIDANEPDDGHPHRVPVAAGGRESGQWRRPFRDAVLAEARRRRRLAEPGSEQAPPRVVVTLG